MENDIISSEAEASIAELARQLITIEHQRRELEKDAASERSAGVALAHHISLLLTTARGDSNRYADQLEKLSRAYQKTLADLAATKERAEKAEDESREHEKWRAELSRQVAEVGGELDTARAEADTYRTEWHSKSAECTRVIAESAKLQQALEQARAVMSEKNDALSSAITEFHRISGLAFRLGKKWPFLPDIIKKADTALAACGDATAKEPVSPWLPISTAPENQSILVYIPNAEHYGEGVYRGMLVNMGTGKRWMTSALHCGRDCTAQQPIGWMPLPPSPESKPDASEVAE